MKDWKGYRGVIMKKSIPGNFIVKLRISKKQILKYCNGKEKITKRGQKSGWHQIFQQQQVIQEDSGVVFSKYWGNRNQKQPLSYVQSATQKQEHD